MITLLLAEIVVEPGWAVGVVPLDDPALDRDVLVGADGQPWVPGSSLAGSLRAHLRAHDSESGTSLETTLMGSRPDDPSNVSLLWLLGTRFTPDPDPALVRAAPDSSAEGASATGAVLETVGQTGIDRFRSAATAKSLRYSRSVASGGVLTAYLRFEGELTDDGREVLASWRPTVGRDRSTGGGRARLRSLRYGTVDPADKTRPDGMRAWLTHSGEALVTAVATTSIPIPDNADTAWLLEELVIEDALLVGDPSPTGPARPRTRAGQPLVPGSAWKGVFRARVEYILRSLYGEKVVCRETGGCGECLSCEVFGHQKGRGLLAFNDSVIDTIQRFDETTGYPTRRTHVSIDRVTGGARDGLLFESVPVTVGRLHLRIDALGHVDDWVHVAVRHVLCDLHDGLIGVGSRVTRGMGTLRLVTEPKPPGPLVIANPNRGVPSEVNQ